MNEESRHEVINKYCGASGAIELIKMGKKDGKSPIEVTSESQEMFN